MSTIGQVESRYIDTLRAVAVIGVLVVHTSQWSFSGTDRDQDRSGILNYAYETLSFGRFGVELFFLLSGYLLWRLYGRTPFLTSQYMASRFLRIYPLWLVFGLIWFFIWLLEGRDLSWAAAGLFLTSTFMLWASPDHYLEFLAGSWSIQIEVVCYFLFLILKKWSISTLILFASAINVSSTLLTFLSIDEFGVLESLRRLSLQTGLNFFIAGILSAKLFEFISKSEEPLSSISRGIRESRHFLPAGLWIISFVTAPHFYGDPLQATASVLLAALLTLFAIDRGRFSGWLIFIGRRSYFVFFSHFVLLHMLSAFPLGNLGLAAVLVTMVAAVLILLVCLAFAEISYRYFENPIRASKRYLLPRRANSDGLDSWTCK